VTNPTSYEDSLSDDTPAEKHDEFAFDAWLDGATVAQASVDILQDGSLLGRYQEWERRYDKARQLTRDDAETSLDDDNGISALEAEGRELIARMQAAHSTWYLRALTSADQRAIDEAHPLPPSPPQFDEPTLTLQDRATDAQARAYLAAVQAQGKREATFNEAHAVEREAWTVKARAVIEARGAERIVRSLDRIEVAGRVIARTITLERALSLPEKIGEAQTAVIMTAIQAATEAEPEVPAPFSRSNSGDAEI
jgi:hypothetical protein